MKLFVPYYDGNYYSIPVKISNRNMVEFFTLNNNLQWEYNTVGSTSESTWPKREIRPWSDVDPVFIRNLLRSIFEKMHI